MAERRRFKRIEIDIAVKCRIVDPQKKTDVSGDITARAKNLSEGGVLLDWPRSWPCNVCFNCLGWIYNMSCKLKESAPSEEEFNKNLVPEIHITLHLEPSGDLEPVSTLAKVSWVRPPENQNINRYQVGISFVEGEKKEQDLKRSIAVIKKRLESN